MKTLPFLLLLFVFPVVAQTSVTYDTVDVYQQRTVHAGLRTITIPCDFDKHALKVSVPGDLKSLTIERVDLVYSLNRENPDFDQKALNRQRMEALRSAWPATVGDLVQWHMIGQGQTTNEETARSLFHGFVVYYRPAPTPESIDAELKQIDEFLKGGVSDVPLEGEFLAEALTESDVTEPRSKEEEVKSIMDRCEEEVSGVFHGTEKQFSAFRDSIQQLDRLAMYSWKWTWVDAGKKKPVDYEYTYCVISAGSALPLYGGFFDAREYDAVKATFERHPSWENTLVVMDVTGSMSPYIAKTMAWVKETQKKSQVSAFTFFNDGDRKSDRSKITGKVEGIYMTENSSFDDVYRKMQETMRAGGGGDCPENNVEASLKAILRFPDVNEVVMVADNWASPRDLSLTYELERPVHIIVCGNPDGINVDYVQLALDTGGSVHTIDQDLEMRNIEPGKQFRLGNSYFTTVDGKVVRAVKK